MPNEVPIAGFWSYSRRDDEAEGGRITELGRDLVAQFELLTGQTIALFLDRDSLEWGEQWRDAIDAGVRNSAFFVAVLTPRYFQSVACRNELQTFARKAQALGVKDLVLPVKYVPFPDFSDESPPDDQLMALAMDFQWVDWTDTRYAARNTERYRRAVGVMAERLARVNRELDLMAAEQIAEDVPSEPEDDAPGTLDLMETAERVLPQWTKTVEDIGEAVESVGGVFTEATEEIRKQEARGGSSFASRVAVARRTAHELIPHSERIHGLGMEFARQIHDIDSGVQAMLQAIIDNPPQEAEDIASACELLGSMSRLAASMRGSLDQMDGMLGAMEQIARQSRDLRAPLGVMREGLTSLREGQSVADTWESLIAEVDIECGGVVAQLE